MESAIARSGIERSSRDTNQYAISAPKRPAHDPGMSYNIKCTIPYPDSVNICPNRGPGGSWRFGGDVPKNFGVNPKIQIRLVVTVAFAARAAQAASATGASLRCEVDVPTHPQTPHVGKPFGWRVIREAEVLMSGDVAAVHVNGGWWATPPSQSTAQPHASSGNLPRGGASAGVLQFVSQRPTSGTDSLGRYTGVTVQWSAGNGAPETKEGTVWETGCRSYPELTEGGSAVVFTSGFPGGAQDTVVPSATADDGVLSNWPLTRAVHSNLTASFSWASEFVGPTNGPSYGAIGGPIVFYSGADPTGRSVAPVVVSPLDNFKVGSSAKAAFDGTPAAWAPGTLGTVESLPRGYEHSWVVYSPAAPAGVTAAVHGYGRAMQRIHNTTRVDDITVEKLQYQTDNGAEYCFCTEKCDEKLLSTKAALDASKATPSVASLSFQGGWWKNPKLHTAGCAPWCVSSWEANTTKFPTGETFKDRWNQPFQLYAPYFCRDTPYAAQWPMLDSDTTLPGCGGAPAYAFKTPEPDSSEAFYTWLMDYGKTHWGMSSFEPDFLHQNFVCVSEFLANATAAKVWFDGMSAAATKQNLAMQWCMATPADVLNALSYPSVTNFRVTTDYYYGHSWDVGRGSLLTWALGVRPSKDTFWTSNQSDIAVGLGGCPHGGCPADHSNSGAVLHTLIALMTTGPVGFSDAAGRTNGTLLAATALQDGTLVQPSRPALPIDLSYGSSWSNGYVLATQSGGEQAWGWYVLAHQLSAPFQVVPTRDLYGGPAPSASVLWRTWDGTAGGCVNQSALTAACASPEMPVLPAAVKGEAYYHPTLVVGSVLCSSQWALLGDLTKFASLSTDLFASVECTPRGLQVQMAEFSGSVVVTAVGHARVVTLVARGGQTLKLGSD